VGTFAKLPGSVGAHLIFLQFDQFIFLHPIPSPLSFPHLLKPIPTHSNSIIYANIFMNNSEAKSIVFNYQIVNETIILVKYTK
jgi:hypothetical protein